MSCATQEEIGEAVGLMSTRFIRTITGLLTLAALAYFVYNMELNLAQVRATKDSTIFQLMYVVLENTFYLVGTIGASIAVYIATRWD